MLSSKLWKNLSDPPMSIAWNGESFFNQTDIEISTDSSDECGYRRQRVRYCSRTAGLAVMVNIRWFSESCCDWLTEMENVSSKPTPIIDRLSTIDASFQIEPNTDLVIHGLRGGNCSATDFMPYTFPLPEHSRVAFIPEKGRSSSMAMPFFNIVGEDKCIAVAIGWTGQWAAFFERINTTMTVACGMESFRAYLNPGERIRQPRIFVAEVNSPDPADGWNAIRRVVYRHYTTSNAHTPICYTTPGTIWEEVLSQKNYDGDAPVFEADDTKKAAVHANEENQSRCIDAAAKAGCEAYWMDAYWYKEGFPNGVGNWEPRADGFPNGLKVLADKCHEKGIKFVLWFEPERIMAGTELTTLHPEYLLKNPMAPGQFLFNLSDENAVRFLSDYISEKITRWNVDIYRQDFNAEPLATWRFADTTNRDGITEAKYVAGLYTFWSNLLERHPGLMIDNCASGGRRIDIETLSLSVPLWRSDTPDVCIWHKSAMRSMPLSDQVQCGGLSRIVPYHSGGVWAVDPYIWRSAMGTGPQVYFNLLKSEDNYDLTRKAIAEAQSLRKFAGADFYNLTDESASLYDWCAWQFHLEESNEGYALFFRRRLCEQLDVSTNLRRIRPEGIYEYSIALDFEEPAIEQISGGGLRDIMIHIPDAPGSALLRYRLARLIHQY